MAVPRGSTAGVGSHEAVPARLPRTLRRSGSFYPLGERTALTPNFFLLLFFLKLWISGGKSQKLSRHSLCEEHGKVLKLKIKIKLK